MHRINNKPEKVRDDLLKNGLLSGDHRENKDLPTAPGRYHKKDLGRPYGFIQGKQGSYDVYNEEGNPFILGIGGTSKVKLVQNRETGQWRALKIIYSHTNPLNYHFLPDKDARNFYEREYRILNKLKRIDPARIITTSKDGVNKYQIIMDLAQGHELFELVSGKKQHLLPKNPEQLLRIGLNILLDLFKIHQAGILLIDDKSENIIVDPDTLEITRIDFGFAEDSYDFKRDEGVTTKFKGTLETSAPEILKRISQGRSVTFNQATDIYSVGATLRELLMGEDFILRENSISGAVDYSNPKILIQQSRITSIGDYPAIKKLLKQMTSDNPQKRPSLVHAIEQFEQALGLEPGTSIAQLKAQLTESNSSQPTSIVSDTKAMVSPKQIHSNDKKYDSRKTLTDIQVQQALNQYQREKNGLLRTGIRWYFTSTATLKAAAELTHHKKHFLGDDDTVVQRSSGNKFFVDEKNNACLLHVEHGKYYYYEKNNDPGLDHEQKQYETAKTFILNNPHTTFAKKLAYTMKDDALIQTVLDARPWWRRCFS